MSRGYSARAVKAAIEINVESALRYIRDMKQLIEFEGLSNQGEVVTFLSRMLGWDEEDIDAFMESVTMLAEHVEITNKEVVRS